MSLGAFNKEFADPLISCVVPLDLVEMWRKVYEGTSFARYEIHRLWSYPPPLKIGDEVVVMCQKKTQKLCWRDPYRRGARHGEKLFVL